MLNISVPTLIVDEERARRNIMRMISKTMKNEIRFRPHFKTHQSAEIGNWFKEYGVSSITVSSVDMAIYFMKNGWDDITIAIPVNLHQIKEIDNLAQKIILHILVESMEAVMVIDKILKNPVNIWIEIDIGYPRTGIAWNNENKLHKVAESISKAKNLILKGILTHAGHAYDATSIMELEKIHKESVSRMNTVKDFLISKGYDNIEISIGDTPTCSIIEDFHNVDEIRPGNFVFFDLMQFNLGVCKEDDIAIAVAVPIIAIHPERNELVVHGGAIHLSNEFIILNDKKSFGKVILRKNNQWSSSIPETYVKSISQEHGIIYANKKFLKDMKIGDIIYILPVHSCLTANLFSSYLNLNGTIMSNIHSCKK